MLCALRQLVGRDLHDRADHDEVPVRPSVGDGREQVDVEPLVEHAVEAEARLRQSAWSAGSAARGPGRNGRRSTDDGKRMDVGVAVVLGLVEANSRR